MGFRVVPLIDPKIPPAIIDSLVKCYGLNTAIKLPSGFSGARIFRCRCDDDREFALRVWPNSTKPERVHEVHDLMSFVRNSGGSFVPQLFPIVASQQNDFAIRIENEIWELQSWMAGQPLPVNASLKQISAGASAIARFHSLSAARGSQEQVATGVRSRANRIHELDQLLPKAFSGSLRSTDSKLQESMFHAVDLVQRKWPVVKKQMNRLLERYLSLSVRTQYVLRDVHREHILFDQDHVRGLIDFDAVRIDWPVFDLCRWGGSFLVATHSPEDVWEAIAAGYGAESPLSTSESSMLSIDSLREMDFCSTWISLSNWLVWLCAESRVFPNQDQAIAERIENLVQRASQSSQQRI